MTSGINLNQTNNQQDPRRDQDNRTQQREAPMSNTTAYTPFQYGGAMLAGTFGQTIHNDIGSEAFNKVVEVMTKAVEGGVNPKGFDVLPFPREVHTDLSFSVIVVTRNNNVRMGPNAPQHNYITAQVIIIEASGEQPRAYEAGRDGRQAPYMVTPLVEQTFNAPLIKYLTEKMSEGKYAGNNAAINFIDPIVLRRDMDLTNVERIRQITVASTTAVETRAQVRMPGFQDYNYIAAYNSSANNDIVLPVTVTVVPETQTDLTGRLFHSDAQVTVSVEVQGNRNNMQHVFNGANPGRDICTTRVGIDLIPVPEDLLEENRASGRGRSRDRIDAKAAWAPRLTARNIDQHMIRTPGGIMFAVASMSELARDREYAQTFRQKKGQSSKSQNLRDIGYLNIEANLSDDDSRYGEPLITTGSEFDDRALGIFLDATVTRSPILSVDCLTSGVQAYTTTALYLAARGSKTAMAKANAELMHSMNCATNGELENLIDMSTSVIVGEGELVHVGTWLDNDNKQRDLFELDNYLAMAVLGGTNNPGLAEEWFETYIDTRNSEEKNMADRLRILSAASSGSLNVTGTALRVEIDGNVVQAFVEATRKGKLPLVPRASEGDLFTATRHVRNNADRAMYRGTGFGRSSVREGGRGTNRFAPDRF